MSRLAGRVAVVTGAGRGLGRSHALALAAEGCAVVVNDLGSDLAGTGQDASPAHEVVAQIQDLGGRAVVSFHDVADWQQAADLVGTAVDAFGRLDVLVNNAGILRDRTLANLTEDEWSSVLRVQLTGHAAPTRHAMAHWRAAAKRGEEVAASVVMTGSVAGFAGNVGQASYSSAKAALLGLSAVVSLEGARLGVRSNVVSPGARTRLSVSAVADLEAVAPPADGAFDPHDPAHVSPLVVWLALRDCPADRQVFHLHGDRLVVAAMPTIAHEERLAGGWDVAALEERLPGLLQVPTSLATWLGVEDDGPLV